MIINDHTLNRLRHLTCTIKNITLSLAKAVIKDGSDDTTKVLANVCFDNKSIVTDSAINTLDLSLTKTDTELFNEF